MSRLLALPSVPNQGSVLGGGGLAGTAGAGCSARAATSLEPGGRQWALRAGAGSLLLVLPHSALVALRQKGGGQGGRWPQ